jgi:predicted nucleotidyltransferase/biotin operon repressor
MLSLASSSVALQALLLIGQKPEGSRVAEVARALGVSYTGAEKAMEALERDGLAVRSERRYRPLDSARASVARDFAIAALPVTQVLGALASGSPAVEFAGVDGEGFLIVLRRFVEPQDESRLLRALERMRDLRGAADGRVIRKEDLRDGSFELSGLRVRAQAMDILCGGVDRTFRDPTTHGRLDARPLGRLHPSIHRPSQARLSQLATAHGVRRIQAFGSATREDFRADSDIDLLVEPRPGRLGSVGERARFIAEAETIFGRDVDLVMSPPRNDSLAGRVKREGVTLYDAARR